MRISLFVGLACVLFVPTVYAQNINFPNRQAIVLNEPEPMVVLSGFSFENVYERSTFRLRTELSWRNASDRPITAFEVVVLEYDPFNRPINRGGRWLITGKNSGNWLPLAPGEQSSDGLIGLSDEPVLTAIAFVRAIRFEDGTIWSADIESIERQIRGRLPVLTDLGELTPEPDSGEE